MANGKNQNPEYEADAFEAATAEIEAETVTTQEFTPEPASEPIPESAPQGQVPHVAPVPAPPSKKQYPYPRKMLIAAFVLGIVGTSLAVIALILSLVSLGSGDFGRGGGRGGHRADISITESFEDGSGRMNERFTEDFDVRERGGRMELDREMMEERFGQTDGRGGMRDWVFESETESEDTAS